MNKDFPFHKVFVTGGAGLIGSHIVELLLNFKEVEEVIVYDNFTRGRFANLSSVIHDSRLKIVIGDIRDRSYLEKAMFGSDLVYHEAAIRITQCAEEPRLAMEVLGDGSFNVYETAAKLGVKKLITASSASIYGLADEFPTSEKHHPYNNCTLYGAAKVFNEGLLSSFNDMFGLNYVVLRYFNVYGPRMDIFGVYTEVFIRWMDAISQGQPPSIFGDGKQTMDFIYVDDIARANILAAQSSVSGQAFNVASGTETSLTDLATALLTVMGSSLQPTYGPARKVNPVSRRLANIDKAKKYLNFSAEVSLEEGLRQLVEWWKNEKIATDNYARIFTPHTHN